MNQSSALAFGVRTTKHCKALLARLESWVLPHRSPHLSSAFVVLDFDFEA